MILKSRLVHRAIRSTQENMDLSIYPLGQHIKADVSRRRVCVPFQDASIGEADSCVERFQIESVVSRCRVCFPFRHGGLLLIRLPTHPIKSAPFIVTNGTRRRNLNDGSLSCFAIVQSFVVHFPSSLSRTRVSPIPPVITRTVIHQMHYSDKQDSSCLTALRLQMI